MDYRYLICNSIHHETHDTISVDGNVEGATQCFDHHHPNGAETQLEELPDRFICKEGTIFCSPKLDEDCVISTAVLISGGRKQLGPAVEEILLTASRACDQLTEGNPFFYFLKDYNYQLINQFKPLDHTEQTNKRYQLLTEATCLFISSGRLPDHLLKPNANGYYLRYLEKQKVLLFRYNILSHLTKSISYINIKDNAFVSPEVFYPKMRKSGRTIAITEFRSRCEGRVYSIGIDPLSTLEKERTFEVFEALNAVDTGISESNRWGGRAGVGGSPYETGSSLSPRFIAEIIEDIFSRSSTI